MKICASCGASLPDQAAFCVACGSTEFRTGNASGYQQQYGGQYNNNYGGQQYGNQYDIYNNQQYNGQYQNNYDNQYDEQYQDGYDNQYDGQYQDGYDNQYDGQYQDNYDSQYDEQYQDNYDNQYDEQYQDNYDNSQYDEQYQDNYDNQYDEQYQDSYDNNQYDEQYQDNYDNQYQNSYANQQYEEPQQPVQKQEPDIIEQIKAKESGQSTAPSKTEKPAEEMDALERIKAEEAKNPYEDSKNFKFEKKEEPEEEEEEKPKPENLKEYINMYKEMILNTKDHTFEYDRNDIQENSKISIISCLGVTFWVPMAFKKDSRVGRFYANQGLLMLIILVASTLLFLMFSGIVGIACSEYIVDITNPGGGTRLRFIGYVLDLLFFAICYAIPIFLFLTGYRDIKAGKVKDLPLVGKLRLLRM